MRNKVVLTVLTLLAIGLAACGGAPKVDWELKINGAVDKPLTLTYSELTEMPQADLKDILMERSEGEDTLESWTGVSLAEIFGQAGTSANYAGITATAADGYAIEITRDELQDAIVALKQNGEWIATADEEHGPIRLVCPNTPANRWVFQLQEIQVNEAISAGGIPADAALKITGHVETEVGWAEDKIRAMDAIEAESTNKKGETKTYTGVLINDLLSKASPKADATTLVFVADDGYNAEVALAEVQACADCIVSFRSQGGFSIVAPGFPGNVQVKGAVEIQVK